MNVKYILALAVAVIAAGCATITPPQSNTETKSARVESAVTTPGFDGVALTVGVTDYQGIDPITGKNNGIWNRHVGVYQNTPLGYRLLEVATGAVVPSIIQGEAVKKVAKIGKCAEGANCGTVINSVANSASQSLNDTRIRIGLPCIFAGNCGTLGD